MGKVISIFLLAVLSISCEQEPFDEGVELNGQDITEIVLIAHGLGLEQYTRTTYIGYFKTYNGVTAEEKMQNAYTMFLNSDQYDPGINCTEFDDWLFSPNDDGYYNAEPDFYIDSANNYLEACQTIDAIPLETLWVEYNLETIYNNGDQVFIP